MRIRSLYRSLETRHPYSTGGYGRSSRSRKPVWAVSSIEGSNPSLSAKRGAFLALCRINALLQAVADGVDGGSTRASVGPTRRHFVPPTFPPDVPEFVPDEPSAGELGHMVRAPIGEQSGSFICAGFMPARTSADCQVVIAAHSRARTDRSLDAGWEATQ
jgi:hypothetical protein